MCHLDEELVRFAVNIEDSYQSSHVLKIDQNFRRVCRLVDFSEKVKASIKSDNNRQVSVVGIRVSSHLGVGHALEEVQPHTTQRIERFKILTDIRCGHADLGHAKALSASHQGVMGLDALVSLFV